jgi:hypothetical protein
MLDVFVALIGHALNCAQNRRITRRRRNDRHKGALSAYHNSRCTYLWALTTDLRNQSTVDR